MSPSIVERAVESAFTLYMLLILIRWLAGFLELNLYDIRFRWIGRLVDPLISAVRRILPTMGPMDFAPVATLLIVWLVRELVLAMLAGPSIRPIGV